MALKAWNVLTNTILIGESAQARGVAGDRSAATCGAVQPQPQVLPSQQSGAGASVGSPADAWSGIPSCPWCWTCGAASGTIAAAATAGIAVPFSIKANASKAWSVKRIVCGSSRCTTRDCTVAPTIASPAGIALASSTAG